MRLTAALRLKPGAIILFGDDQYTALLQCVEGEGAAGRPKRGRQGSGDRRQAVGRALRGRYRRLVGATHAHPLRLPQSV